MKTKTERTLVVYVCETRSLIQREENLQRVFENRVVKKTRKAKFRETGEN
jgi:G:T-mismatch repair DNA endonuclease (very short patch repair protein)